MFTKLIRMRNSYLVSLGLMDPLNMQAIKVFTTWNLDVTEHVRATAQAAEQVCTRLFSFFKVYVQRDKNSGGIC
jgi:hypothetical protein